MKQNERCHQIKHTTLLIKQTYWCWFCTFLQQNTHSSRGILSAKNILLLLQLLVIAHCGWIWSSGGFQVRLIFDPVTGFHSALQGCVFEHLENVQDALFAWGWMFPRNLSNPSHRRYERLTLVNRLLSVWPSLYQAVSHLNPSSWECCLMMFHLCKSTPRSLKAHRHHLMTNDLQIKETVDMRMFMADKLHW